MTTNLALECTEFMLTENELDNLFNKLDIDHSGHIDREEFAQGLGEIAAAVNEKLVESVFRRFDINGDQELDCRELRRFLKSYAVSNEGIAKFLRATDVNEDRKA